MDRLEVLCVTMHQQDFSKLEQMHIDSDVLFANQADTTAYQELPHGSFTARMITTQTRGVGKNRNLALLHARGDILLLADDDITYAPDYREQVLSAFRQFPDADLVIFSMDFTRDGQVYRSRKNADGRITLRKGLRYGAASCAVRRESLVKSNLWFSTRFGGGTDFGHGEDTLFLSEAFRKGLKVYTSSYCLGQTASDSSSWFQGYDEKYFYDQGVLYKSVFGILAVPMAVQYCVRKRGRFSGQMPVKQAFAHMLRGIRAK